MQVRKVRPTGKWGQPRPKTRRLLGGIGWAQATRWTGYSVGMSGFHSWRRGRDRDAILSCRRPGGDSPRDGSGATFGLSSRWVTCQGEKDGEHAGGGESWSRKPGAARVLGSCVEMQVRRASSGLRGDPAQVGRGRAGQGVATSHCRAHIQVEATSGLWMCTCHSAGTGVRRVPPAGATGNSPARVLCTPAVGAQGGGGGGMQIWTWGVPDHSLCPLTCILGSMVSKATWKSPWLARERREGRGGR